MKAFLSLSLSLSVLSLYANNNNLLTSGSYTVGSFLAGSAPQGIGIYTDFGLANGFVANRDDNTVGYFDASDPQIAMAGSFSVLAPYWISFCGTTGYVTQQILDNVTYFDATSLNPVALGSFSVSGYPNQIAFNGTVGFVTLYDDDKVGIIDTIAKTISGSFSVGAKPLGIMVVGGTGFVANNNTNSISFFDATNPVAALGQITLPNLFDRPNNLASFGTTGFVSVLSVGHGGYVGFFNTENPSAGLNGSFTLTGSTGDYPYGIVVNATVNGFATGYVTNVSTSDVFIFDAANPSIYTPSNLPGSITVGNSPFHLAFNKYTTAVSQIGFVSPKTQQAVAYFYMPLTQNVGISSSNLNWSSGTVWNPPMVPSPVSSTNLSGLNSTINLGTFSALKLFSVGNEGEVFANSLNQESGSVTLTNGVLNLYGTNTLISLGTTSSVKKLRLGPSSLRHDSSVKTQVKNSGFFRLYSGTFTSQGAIFGDSKDIDITGNGSFVNEGYFGRDDFMDTRKFGTITNMAKIVNRESGEVYCKNMRCASTFENAGKMFAERMELEPLVQIKNDGLIKCSEGIFGETVEFLDSVGDIYFGVDTPASCEFKCSAIGQSLYDEEPITLNLRQAKYKKGSFINPLSVVRGGFQAEEFKCKGEWTLSPPLEMERQKALVIDLADVENCDMAFRTTGYEFDQMRVLGNAMFNEMTTMSVYVDTPPDKATMKIIEFNNQIGQLSPDQIFVSAPLGVDAKVVGVAKGYWLLINGGVAELSDFPGNAGVSAHILTQIDGNCPSTTQAIIDSLSGLSYEEQYQALKQLTPAYKVIQYNLEKLNFLLQKELQDILYKYQRGFRPYLIAGFDHLHQDQSKYYTGYGASNFYQLAGFSYGYNRGKFVLGTGVSESDLKLHPLKGHADYLTVYANTGLSIRGARWRFGLEGLYGHSFFHTSRQIPFYDLKATSSHNGWNASVESHLVYKVHSKKWTFQPYDDVGYLYGIEKNYQEKGAPGANFYVKNEHISVIRNALGCIIDAPRNQALKGYVDLAWVYENFLSSKFYQAAFEQTSVFGDYRQIVPAKNYLRSGIGMIGRHHNLEWQLGYLGLFGKKFAENSASFKLSSKF